MNKSIFHILENKSKTNENNKVQYYVKKNKTCLGFRRPEVVEIIVLNFTMDGIMQLKELRTNLPSLGIPA